MKSDPEKLFLQLRGLMSQMPELEGPTWKMPESRAWLGRAHALIEALGDSIETMGFRHAMDDLGTAAHQSAARRLTNIVFRAVAKAELAAPAAVQGQFIAAGETLSALAAVSKVFARAQRDLLLVDSFADNVLITDFATSAPESAAVRILCGDKENRKATLRPLVQRWAEQFGSARVLSVRVVPSARLHDRLVLVDLREVWMLGQSFNNMARSTHTSIMRADEDLAAQKVAAYEDLWAQATSI